MVVTIRDGKIVEMKGRADRAAGMAYAHTGETPDTPASSRLPQSPAEAEEVHDLRGGF